MRLYREFFSCDGIVDPMNHDNIFVTLLNDEFVFLW